MEDKKSSVGVSGQAQTTGESFDDSQVFEWNAPEFEYHEKGKSWILGLIGIAVVLIVLFVFIKNWLGIVVTILMAVLIYQYAFKKPEMMHFILTKEGLVVGDKLFKFDSLKSFWITIEGVLHVDTRQVLPPRLSIGLESVDVEALEKFLEHYLPKVDRKVDDSSDRLSRWLKL